MNLLGSAARALAGGNAWPKPEFRLRLALCHQLDRPVCSADLAADFAKSTEYQPLFLQRLGQVLIKTARARSQDAIYRIGIVGRFAYYAPDTAPHWFAKLRAHDVEKGVERQLRINLPLHSEALLGTVLEPFARNALAGFRREWETKNAHCGQTKSALAQRFDPVLRAARAQATAKFVAGEPTTLVPRKRARHILRTEHGRLVQSESHLSLQRHLALLRWPQSDLFSRERPQCFADLQVRCYCLAKWPFDPVFADIAKAVALCLSYGVGADEALIEEHSRAASSGRCRL